MTEEPHEARTAVLPDMTDGLSRASRRERHRASCWQIPLFLVSVLAWVVFLCLGHHREVRKVEDPNAAAARIARAYRTGDDEKVMREASAFAEVYPAHEKRSAVEFEAGMSAYRLAESTPARADILHGRAIDFLETAIGRGLDAEQRLVAKETLGLSCLERGEYGRAVDVFTELRQEFPEKTARVLLARAKAEFRLGRVDVARRGIESYLELPDLSPSHKVAAHLELAEGYRLAGRLDDAERTYRRVIEEYPRSSRRKEAHFGLALTLRAKGRSPSNRLDDAGTEFRKVVRMLPRMEGLNRQAGLFAGECLYEKGDYAAAALEFRKLADDCPGTPEATAALLRIASINVDEKRFDAARDALTGLLDQVPENGRLVNDYVSPEEINSIWRDLLRHYLAKGEYEELAKLNGDTRKVAGHHVYVYQQAGLYRHHGRRMREEAAGLREQGLTREAVEREEEARRSFRRAGRLLVRIINGIGSDLRLYGRALEQSADSLYEAGDYAGAVVQYRLVLTSVGGGKDAHRTLVQYARALQALGRHEEASRQLERCIRDYPGTPSVYEAMLARAETYLALGDLASAQTSLEEIVCRTEVFSPTGKVWRRALSELACVYYRRGKFKQAVEKLDEVLTREGVLDCSRFSRLQITYCLADAYRCIGSPAPGERRTELTRAAEHFSKVHRGEAEGVGTTLETWMIRRSYLAQADCRYELGEYGRALKLYERGAEKYLDSAEGVGARFGVAACLNRLGGRERAVEAAERARWSLAKLKKDKPEQATRFLEDACAAMLVWRPAEGGS